MKNIGLRYNFHTEDLQSSNLYLGIQNSVYHLIILSLIIRFDPDTGCFSSKECIRLEQDLFARELVGTGTLYVYHTNNFWSQIKNAG